MANLKALRVRITSVKSTQKITSAMKMVAASKLRRAQSEAEAARPYADRMARMLAELVSSLPTMDAAPKLLAGSGEDKTHLLVVMTADRGLCGGFNGNIVRAARRKTVALQGEGKTVKLFCIGRKGREALKREYGDLMVETLEDVTRTGVDFRDAKDIAASFVKMFEAEEFDVCTLFFNRFQSAMTQVLTEQQLIPFPLPEKADDESAEKEDKTQAALYIMEPSEEEILDSLLPRNLSVQTFRALLENNASEQGARMTAMDSATRNAGDMLDDLTITYNRTRQAVITSELIEIISGAEAL
jgi:F-type H+-transporting ATPase subunit gamma